MINFFKKISWRLKIILKSIKPLILAFIFEFNKHPWEYIINYIILNSNKRYEKSGYFIQKYFRIKIISYDKIIIDFGYLKLNLNNNFYKNNINLTSLLILYYDLVYSTITKYPIPIILEEGPYELDNFKIEQGDYVIDCGANIGFFTFLASNKVTDTGKIFAFEPINEANKIINDSKEINNFPDNIVVIPKAVGSSEKKISFNVSNENLGGSTKSNNGNRIIEQTTIDKFVENNNIDRIDFIKMDIEGMEIEAIKGAENTIKKFKPKLSLCIYHNKDDLKNLKKIINSTRDDYKYYNTSHKLYAW